MASSALIGHTGFVGSNLARQHGFQTFFNSSSIDQIVDEHFDLVVCAGVSANKWQANAEPEADRAGLLRLTQPLSRIRARHFVLISTVDVYADPAAGADEDAMPDGTNNHPYGRHRLEFEQWIRAHFADSTIVRLPALFGPGLKKNALFDLVHGNRLDFINPRGVFQWYSISRLWHDICRVRTEGVPLVNLVTEPLAMERILSALFADKAVGGSAGPAASYDLRTKYAKLFGGSGGYMASADDCLREIGTFVDQERRR